MLALPLAMALQSSPSEPILARSRPVLGFVESWVEQFKEQLHDGRTTESESGCRTHTDLAGSAAGHPATPLVRDEAELGAGEGFH
jgi:hypothetical protein